LRRRMVMMPATTSSTGRIKPHMSQPFMVALSVVWEHDAARNACS
jgi:hypothetical protein